MDDLIGLLVRSRPFQHSFPSRLSVNDVAVQHVCHAKGPRRDAQTLICELFRRPDSTCFS